MPLGIRRQRPHVGQERADPALLHDGAGGDAALGHGPRAGGVAGAVALDGGAVVGLDHARDEALVAVQGEEAVGGLGTRGRGGGGGARRRGRVVVELGPEGADGVDAGVGLGGGGGGGGAEGAGAVEAPVVEEVGPAGVAWLEGAVLFFFVFFL